MNNKQVLTEAFKLYQKKGRHAFMCCLLDNMLQNGVIDSDQHAKAIWTISKALCGCYTLSSYLRTQDKAYSELLGPDNKWSTKEAFNYRVEWFRDFIEKLEE